MKEVNGGTKTLSNYTDLLANFPTRYQWVQNLIDDSATDTSITINDNGLLEVSWADIYDQMNSGAKIGKYIFRLCGCYCY